MTIDRPQRITPPAPPGTLLKRVSGPPQPKQRFRADPTGDNEAHLALVRQLPCLYCGVEPCGEAAHVKMASGAFGKSLRFGKRPEDRWALPLCRDDHQNARTAQHRRSEAEFWAGLGINALLVCERLYVQRGDVVAMRAVVMVAIAERSMQKDAPIGAGST